MESAEQPINKLHSEVSKNLTNAGHPATSQSVNPNDESALEPIRRDFQDLVGSTLEKVGGASSSVDDRVTRSRVGRLIDQVRRRMKEAA